MSTIKSQHEISVYSPNKTAQIFLEQKYSTPVRTLHSTSDEQFWVYSGKHYQPLEKFKLYLELERFVEHECYILRKKKGTDDYILDEQGQPQKFEFPIDPRNMGYIYKELILKCNEGISKHPHSGPSWVFCEMTNDPLPRADRVIAYENCLFNLEEWVSSGDPHKSIMSHDPRYFCTSYIPITIDPLDCVSPYDKHQQYYPRKKPQGVINFLKSVLKEDTLEIEEFDDEGEDSSVNTLREFGGYLMAQDKRFEKALWIDGPPRSGKGTWCGFLQGFFGREVGLDGGDSIATTAAFCGMDVSAFIDRFGFEDLLGKNALFLNDPQLENHHGDVWKMIERMKILISKDSLTIPRKGRTSLPSVVLPIKIIVNANYAPDIEDSTGSFLSRFIYIKFRESFLGKEDPLLLAKMYKERPVAIWWFLTGYRNLIKRGRFVQPISCLRDLQEMADENNPVSLFVKDRCVVGKEKSIEKGVLHNSFCEWICSNGGKTMTEEHFSRKLKKVIPAGLHTIHPRGKKRRWEGIGLSDR